MKIDKILFSVSEPEEYSSFWNMQSRIWRSMGIEPVCLLFGKKANTDMTEEYGKIIEREFFPDLPWSVQLVWSKFDYPTEEPETTWLIGDMDLVPLQRAHFTKKIEETDPNHIAHLNAGGISQPRLGSIDGFLTQGPQRFRKDHGQTGGADLPGHYWAMKGKHFGIFSQGRSFWDQVNHIISSNRYGLGPMDGKPPPHAVGEKYWHFWCCEENYTSELLWNALKEGRVAFDPLYYNNNHNRERIDRSNWNEAHKTYRPDMKRIAAKQIVDIHCCRPYKRQKDELEKMIEASGVLG
jgi:hypothetical protein